MKRTKLITDAAELSDVAGVEDMMAEGGVMSGGAGSRKDLKPRTTPSFRSNRPTSGARFCGRRRGRTSSAARAVRGSVLRLAREIALARTRLIMLGTFVQFLTFVEIPKAELERLGAVRPIDVSAWRDAHSGAGADRTARSGVR